MRFSLSTLYQKFQTHLVLFITNFIGIICVFISFKLINLISDEKALGIFTLMIVYMKIIAQVINFGLPTFAMKYLSKNRNNYKFEVFHDFYFKILGTILLNTGLCTVFLFCIIILLDDSFYSQFTTFDLIALAALAPITAITLYNSQILRAKKSFFKFQLLNGPLTYGLFCCILFLVYLLKINITTISLIFLVCSITTLIISFFLLALKPQLNAALGIIKIDMKSYAARLKKGSSYLVIQLSTQGLNWITLIYTSYFIGEIETGGFNIILRMAALSGFLKTIINSIMGPDYAYLFNSEKIKNLNSEIKFNTNLLVYLSLPLIVVLFIFPKFFLSLFSADYGHLTMVFRIILVGALMDNFFGSSGLLMQMTKEENTFKRLMLTALLIHLIVGYLLTFSLNVYGLALSLLISALFWNISSAVLLKKRHGIISHFRLK